MAATGANMIKKVQKGAVLAHLRNELCHRRKKNGARHCKIIFRLLSLHSNSCTMKKGIHPAYREVVFKDISCDYTFIGKSTMKSRETITLDGVEYPLIKLDISSRSHPFFTGKQKFVDTAGRVDKFFARYGKK
jgi:large subunit ribosomal protein L31